jgi:serine/threonine protein kinase/WD40 repeat protein
MPEYALLTIESDAGAQQERLSPGSYVIGRGDACDLVVPSLYLKPEHIRLTVTPTQFEIEELGTDNTPRQFNYPQETELGPLCLSLEWTVGDSGKESDKSVERNYATMRELARGGMGKVFEARDQKLGRTVAMKVMLKANATEDERARFYQEARILGQLDHPNIVPIHDLGTDQRERPFYTMKLVQGATLHEILRKLRKGDEGALAMYPLSALLTIFQKVCDAVAFAHSRGIIHRDLKPQNIMVGEFGEALVMDWGLSKILSEPPGAERAPNRTTDNASPADSASTEATALHDASNPPAPDTIPASMDTPPVEMSVRSASSSEPKSAALEKNETVSSEPQLTMDGTILGTPHFMSPEQAEGRVSEIDERTDIFSLGAILYAILTLRPPVGGETVEEILSNVRRGTIITPSKVDSPVEPVSCAPKAPDKSNGPESFYPLRHCPNGRVPHALSAVTMKALSQSAAHRYASVSDLTTDIAAYQGGFATGAEEASALTLLRLFIERHKTLAVAATLVILLSATFLFKVLESERKANQNAELASANAREAATNAAIAEAEAERATTAEKAALEEKEATRQALAKAQVALAEAAYRERDGIGMRTSLGKVPPDLRDADYDYLNLRIDTSLASLRAQSGNPIVAAAPNPAQPGIFAVAGDDHRISLLDARSGRHLSSFEAGWTNTPTHCALAFSPNGSVLAAANGETAEVAIFDPNNSPPLAKWSSTAPIHSIEFTPDGERLLVLSAHSENKGVIQVHSALNGELHWKRDLENSRCNAVCLPSGKAILVTVGQNRVQLLDAKNGEALRELPETPDFIRGSAISPDSQFALLGDIQGRVCKINLATGQTLLNLTVAEPLVSSIAITPDGSRFATLAHSLNRTTVRVELWDATTGAPIGAFLGVAAAADALCLHPTSSELIVTGEGAKSWELFQLQPAWQSPGSLDNPWCGFWGDDDRLFFCDASERASLALLQREDIGTIWTQRNDPKAFRAHMSLDGNRALTASSGGLFSIFERRDDSVIQLPSWKLSGKPSFVRLDRNGQRVWTGTSIYEANTGNKLVDIKWEHSSPPRTGDWIGKERLVAVLHQDVKNFLRLYDSVTGDQIKQAFTGNERTLAIVGAPDGMSFADVGHDKRVRIRDSDSLEVIREFRAHDKDIHAAAFHPTRPILATGSADLSIRLWDLSNGALLEELRGPTAPPRSLAFSPGGLKLACCSEDRGMRIWEPRCLQEESAKTRSPGPTITPGKWRDLIAGIDSADLSDSINEWRLVDGELRNPDRKFAAAPLPGDFVNKSYHLQVGFRCDGDNESLTVFIPVGARQTAFLLDGYPYQGWRSTLHFLDGDGGRYDPNATLGRNIKVNQSYQLDVFVRLSGAASEIEVLLDSKPLYRWQGLNHRLSRNPRFRNMPPGQIGVGAHYPGWFVTSARVRQL